MTPLSIFTISPCCSANVTDTTEDVIFVCLLTGFFPENLSIRWEPQGAATPMAQLATKVSREKSYVGSSHAKVIDRSQTLQCHVQQDIIKGDQYKTFPKDVCRAVRPPPQVSLVTLGCGDEDGEMELELLCFLWSSTAEKVKFSWLRNGEVVPSSSPTEVVDGGRSRLEISRVSWDKGDVYTCKVTRSEGGGVVMRNTSKCTACWPTSLPPQLHVAGPSYADLLAGTAWATCLLLGWSLTGATLAWEGVTGGSPPPTLARHPNGTHSLLLARPLTLRDWVAGGHLLCRATLPCWPDLDRQLPLGPAPGLWKPPRVTVRRVPAADRQGALLLCHLSGFAPGEVAVSWVGGRDPQNRVALGPVTGREVFSVLSALRLEEDEDGRGYACLVQHPALQQPLRVTEGDGVPTVPPTPQTPVKPSPPPGCAKSPPSSLQPPSFHELFLRRAANLTCATPLANATLVWEVGGQPVAPEAVKTGPDGTRGTRSWLRVGLGDWNGTANVSCRLRDGAEETRLEISRRTGPLKPPSIHLLPSSLAEACAGRDFTLFCLVKDFYPPEIAAWWRRGATEGPAAETASCDHQTQSCSLVIGLDVPWGEWVEGTSYGCLVAHISGNEIAEKTVDVRADPWDCAGLHFVPCGLLGNGDDLEAEEDGSSWTTISTFVVLFLLLIFYSSFVTFIKVK